MKILILFSLLCLTSCNGANEIVDLFIRANIHGCVPAYDVKTNKGNLGDFVLCTRKEYLKQISHNLKTCE